MRVNEKDLSRPLPLRRAPLCMRARSGQGNQQARLLGVHHDEVLESYRQSRSGSNWTFLDLTPLSRWEEWQHSPAGWYQTPPYEG